MKKTVFFVFLFLQSMTLLSQSIALKTFDRVHEKNPYLKNISSVLVEEFCMDLEISGFDENDVFTLLGESHVVHDVTDNYHTLTFENKFKDSDSGEFDFLNKVILYSSKPTINYDETDSVVAYEWVAPLNQYFIDNRIINEFDANGNLLSSYEYSDSEVLSSQIFYYEDDTLRYSVSQTSFDRDSIVHEYAEGFGNWRTTWYRLISGDYQAKYRNYNYYNSDGLLDTVYWTEHDAPSWVAIDRTVLQYDNEDRVIFSLVDEPENGHWNLTFRDSIYYEFGNPLFSRRVSQEYKNDSWLTTELVDGQLCNPDGLKLVEKLEFSAYLEGNRLILKDLGGMLNVDISLANISGVKLFEHTYDVLPEKISLPVLPNGMYFVQLHQGSRVGTKKLVKF